MFENIRGDLHRKREWFLKEKSWFVRNIRIFMEPGTIAVIVYRYGRWVHDLPVPVIKQILNLFYLVGKAFVVLGLGIYIPVRANIGKGFTIHNFSGIFICEATIGENCIVFQNVTIGHLRGQPGPPRLGNNVFLGAGAKVLGQITLGNNVAVGANSVVIGDVPDNCTVMGVPARIIARETQWIDEKLQGRGNNY
ncbi:MAG: serine acetyltransferase [Gallionellaceae bacterium]|nr:serine acetyltransferase [Gallionellaceae bacterium]